MIQLQIIIQLPADGRANIALNRLEREDANEDEAKFAKVFEEQYEALIRLIAQGLNEGGMETTFEEVRK